VTAGQNTESAQSTREVTTTYLDLAQLPNRVIVLEIDILVDAIGDSREQNEHDSTPSESSYPKSLVFTPPSSASFLQRNKKHYASQADADGGRIVLRYLGEDVMNDVRGASRGLDAKQRGYLPQHDDKTSGGDEAMKNRDGNKL
jgi:hypothetical protein